MEGHGTILLRNVVEHESAVWRLGDRPTMKVLVLQMRRNNMAAKWLLNGLEIRRCWSYVEVGGIDIWCIVRRQSCVVVASWRTSVAESLWVDASLIDGAEAGVELLERCKVQFVFEGVDIVERIGKARVGERRTSNLARHLDMKRDQI